MVHVPLAAIGAAPDAPFEVEDLLTGSRYTWIGQRNYIRLDPASHVGHVFRVNA
jgi:starch synthase (maltosyl-transferring)